VRVIAGTARGRRLNAPRGSLARPTTDRVKEALFSILQGRLRGAVVCDLYAGSGALGIEALSRGAARVTFIDSDRRAVDAIRANLDATGLDTHAEVQQGVLPSALAAVAGPVDLVLADPPYDLPDDDLSDLLARAARLLADGGIIVVERDRRSAPPTWPAEASPREPRRYGDTTLHFAERLVA
jgi:16S rRNA (guanine966-N2)-methyltransferase